MSLYDIYSMIEVLSASDSKTTVGSPVSSDNHLMFRIMKGEELHSVDAQKIDRLVKYVEDSYSTKLRLIGGDYEPKNSGEPK